MLGLGENKNPLPQRIRISNLYYSLLGNGKAVDFEYLLFSVADLTLLKKD